VIDEKELREKIMEKFKDKIRDMSAVDNGGMAIVSVIVKDNDIDPKELIKLADDIRDILFMLYGEEVERRTHVIVETPDGELDNYVAELLAGEEDIVNLIVDEERIDEDESYGLWG